MMRVLYSLALTGLMGVSAFGLAGQGGPWVRVVGGATVMVMLLTILIQLSNLPTVSEIKRLILITQVPMPAPPADDMDDQERPARRSARN